MLFVYVREALRGNGYARGLLNDLVDEDVIVGAQSHGRETPSGPVAYALPKGWRYNYTSATEWAIAETP